MIRTEREPRRADHVIDLREGPEPGGGQGPRAAPAVGPVTARAAGAWLALIGAVATLLVVQARPGSFLMSSWALSYQRGYRARALPASLLQAAGAERVTQRMVAWIAVVTLLAVLGMLVTLATRAYRARPTWSTLALGVLLVGSPVTLRAQAFELGSLDGVVVALALAGLLVLHGPPGAGRLLLVGALATTGVLVHEASLLLTLPLLLAAVVVRTAGGGRARTAASVAAVVVGPLLALAWTQAAPQIPRAAVPALVAEVEAVAEVDPASPATAWPVLNHTRDLAANVAHTGDEVARRGHGPHLLALLACAPVLLAAAALARPLVTRGRRALLLALWVAAVIAPLTLAAVGHDWGRWLAAGAANGVVAVAWCTACADRGARRPAPPPLVSQAIVAAVALALLTPTLDRGGGFRVRVGQPGALLELLLGL